MLETAQGTAVRGYPKLGNRSCQQRCCLHWMSIVRIQVGMKRVVVMPFWKQWKMLLVCRWVMRWLQGWMTLEELSLIWKVETTKSANPLHSLQVVPILWLVSIHIYSLLLCFCLKSILFLCMFDWNDDVYFSWKILLSFHIFRMLKHLVKLYFWIYFSFSIYTSILVDFKSNVNRGDFRLNIYWYFSWI